MNNPLSHGHSHGVPAQGRHLGLSAGLTLALVLIEAAAGFWPSSLAVPSDAGHKFADALALLLSRYAARAAGRPATRRRTFGYHRVGILAALANALSLVLIAGFIFWEATVRFRDPEDVHGGVMIGVAFVALVLNALISLALRHEARHVLNVRGAYVHMLGDAASSLGVVVAGMVVLFTG
ncbi:MAG: cation transporter [Zavarzinella sp.]|nr:cation transporter [Zavarzinella sp.]